MDHCESEENKRNKCKEKSHGLIEVELWALEISKIRVCRWDGFLQNVYIQQTTYIESEIMKASGTTFRGAHMTSSWIVMMTAWSWWSKTMRWTNPQRILVCWNKLIKFKFNFYMMNKLKLGLKWPYLLYPYCLQGH